MVSPLAPAIVTVAIALSGASLLRADAHVRPLTPMARVALVHGLEHSPSFRALVERLNRSDVVVYVRDQRELPSALAARLTFMTSAGGIRYVMVQLSRRLTPSQQVATLGHELQHAVEIAERSWIVDSRSLADEYMSLALAEPADRTSTQSFETARALAAAHRILGELIR